MVYCLNEMYQYVDRIISIYMCTRCCCASRTRRVLFADSQAWHHEQLTTPDVIDTCSLTPKPESGYWLPP